MKIAVVNIYNFPNGMAPTARIISYCKGLLKEGAKVEIISVITNNETKKTVPISGICDGGNYYHFAHAPNCKIPILRSILWRIKNYVCLHKALTFIKQSDTKESYDAVIMSFDEPRRFEAMLPTLTNLEKAKLIAIADEYPIPIRHYLKKNIPEPKLKRYRKIYQKIDGRILMTTKLKEFYDTNIGPKPTLILSTVVDIDRFANVYKEKQNKDYLCYMGNLELSKDNVDNIIIAFSMIENEYPDLYLFIYGAPNSESRLYLERLIKKLNLTNRVFLKGRVKYDQVPQILKNAKILVSSQPNTKRAEGGFPTKLGEYMITGVPILMTDVGEIAKYVKNGENGYIVPPDNPESYAKQLSFILKNYNTALQVANNAKQYIINNFSTASAGKNIIDFLKRIF